MKIELHDASTFAPVKTLDLAALGLTGIDSTVFSVDGKTLYVLGSGPEVDGEAKQTIVGIAAASGGDKVSSVEVTGTVEDIGTLLTPSGSGMTRSGPILDRPGPTLGRRSFLRIGSLGAGAVGLGILGLGAASCGSADAADAGAPPDYILPTDPEVAVAEQARGWNGKEVPPLLGRGCGHRRPRWPARRHLVVRRPGGGSGTAGERTRQDGRVGAQRPGGRHDTALARDPDPQRHGRCGPR